MRRMCCSIRGAVFFLASVHIFFAVTQMVQTLPFAVAVIGSQLLESTMAFIFCFSFFATGFMTFRGADEESATLIKLGSICLVFVIILRFALMAFSTVLDTLPEAAFLYAYGTPIVPIIFTVALYVVYVVLLICYHNELKSSPDSTRLDSPVHFHSQRRSRRYSHTSIHSIP